MLNAGICAPVPKGDWLNNVQYDPLNMVNHGGYSWIAKRQSLGQEPTEGQYWMQFGTAVPIATTSVAGKVKPDGVSILITGEGVISALLSGLTDVELTDLDDGQVIAWDETENKFVNKDISTTLAGLQDVDLTGLQDGQMLIFNALTNKWEPTDPPSGGFSEVLIDYDPTEMAGITVTLAHTASAEGHTPESYTITLDNTGEVEQDVKNLGLWTITWTHNGQSYTESFDIHYFGYFHIMLHEGFTWRLWATAGGIPINQYDSLSQLLADEAAVRRLFIVHDAVDYMCENANSTQNQDLITIINNGLCAKWANLSDYALDNMEADAVLSDLMDDADLYGYGELVYEDNEWKPKGNVPVMTSNTAPYGECIASASQSSYPTYQAFDKDDTSHWGAGSVDYSAAYIGYKFTNPVKIKEIAFTKRINTGLTYDGKCTAKIQASNDGSDWVDLTDTLTFDQLSSQYGEKESWDATQNEGYYLYVRLKYLTKVVTSDNLYPCCAGLQFYGRELKVSVPKMTSNTAPYGEAIRSEVFSSSFEAWKAFDKVTSQTGDEAWASNLVNTNQYVGYDFKKPTVALMCVWKNRNYNVATDIMPPKNHKIQGSNDGTTWEDVTEVITNSVSTANANHIINMGDNTDSYKAYRMFIVDGIDTGASSGDYVAVGELQFYGKDYSEKEFANDGSKWLYDHGVELEEFTSSGSGVTQKESDSLYCEVSIANVGAVFSSDNVDLTSYNLLRFKLGNTLYAGGNATSYGQMRVQSGDTIVSSKELLTTGQNYPNNEFLDIASVNQSCTIRPLTVNGSSAISRKITFTELWLE